MHKVLQVLVNVKQQKCNLVRFLAVDRTEDHGFNLSTKLYWKQFYKKHDSKPFEWLIEYDKNVLNLDENRFECKLALEPGCGTSEFSFKLLDKKKSFLICADYSSDALKQLKSTGKSSIPADFVLCDCTNLPFRDHLFDVVIDKGYLDSILKSKDMKRTMDSLVSMVDKLAFGKDSFLMQITDEQPELRFDLFDKIPISSLNFYYKEINSGDNDQQSYFIYFLSKS